MSSDPRTNLRSDLTVAIKAKDRVAITALRSALAAIDNAEAQPADHPVGGAENEHIAGAAGGLGATEVARRQLGDADVHAILGKEVHDRRAAAREYERAGRDELAERLRSEARVLSQYPHDADVTDEPR